MGSTYYEFRDAFENGNTRVHPTKPGNIQLISDKLTEMAGIIITWTNR